MKRFKQYLREQEPEKKKKRESGDFWETKPGIWAGKNPDGEIEYYGSKNAKQKAEEAAKRAAQEAKKRAEAAKKKAEEAAKKAAKKAKKKVSKVFSTKHKKHNH